MSEMKDTCETCRYFVRVETDAVFQFECRRYPPTVVGSEFARWPVLALMPKWAADKGEKPDMTGYWCDEHELV